MAAGLARLAVLSWAALTGCVTTPPAALDELQRTLSGRYDNAEQYAAAAPELRRAPSLEQDWIDLQYALFQPVAAPALGNHVIYLEWRSGSPEGPISRQRLWSFREDDRGRLWMDFYTFLAPERYAGRAAEPEAFRTLGLEELRRYPSACALAFERRGSSWAGQIGADRCRIVAASGRTMGIEARIVLAAGRLEYQEAGILDDGRAAFRVPPTMPYRFVKQKR